MRNANLKQAQFDRADLRCVDLSGLKIMDLGQYFKGSIISTDQAAAMVCGLGLLVR